MNCKACNSPLSDEAKFCGKCGAKAENRKPVDKIIKCGNCDYVGPGDPARRLFFTILAWCVVFFAPLITIIYFLATSKYRCPKCHSTFIGVKNKEGTFVQKSNGSRFISVVLITLVGIAFVGIISSVVLASLNAAREKSKTIQPQGDSTLTIQKMNLALPAALRKCPSTQCEVIRYYAETAVVDILGEDETKEWYQIEAKDDDGTKLQGWMSKTVF